MTLQELSVEFDILFNNISSNQAPGLSEYEKSVFLTQAMEAVILDLYKGTGGDSFESTEELTRYLNTLVKTKSIPVDETTKDNDPIFSGKTYIADLSEADGNNNFNNLWFIVYQTATINNKNVLAVPTTLDKVYKEMQNPFKRPNDDRVLVLFQENNAYLISEIKPTNYYIKYLSRPYPIILDDIGELTINGQSYDDAKELSDIVPETMHRSILLRAIQLAQMVWKQS